MKFIRTDYLSKILILLFLCAYTLVKAQFDGYDAPRGKNAIRIMFYNVENLFDTINDPLKNDEEFLPEGSYRWNGYRFQKKLKNTYKVITAVGGWESPDIIGFCELENKFVLEQLIAKTPLRNQQYEIVHYESPDYRGIDVGLIYKKNKFKALYHEALNVSLENDADFKTRDILYVKGLAFGSDTLHLFVNHWPSRRGGETSSEHKRIQAATIARNKIDEILSKNSNAHILLMGDFNDYPDNNSIHKVLQAKSKKEFGQQQELLNLMYEKFENHEGSHKFQGHWGCLDQVMVSHALTDSLQGLFVHQLKAEIFRSPFLLKEDERWMGEQPARTYEGFKYQGDFSDHLPIFTDILKIEAPKQDQP